MEKKHIGVFVIIVLAVACVSSLLTAAIVRNDVNQQIHDAVSNEKAVYESALGDFDTLIEVKDIVDSNFVREVDYEGLDESLTAYYVSLLEDKYSEYLTEEKLSNYMQTINGSFVGVGIVCSNLDGKIHVEEVYKGSPAEEAGILKGENIIAVGDIEVNEENYNEAINTVAGESGTFVTFKIQGTDGSVRTISVERRAIEIPSINSEMLDGNIGYIQITQFSGNTFLAFDTALNELLSMGAEGIIFDVRNNSGGQLEAVVSILDRVLPEGPIVNIIYGNGEKETRNSTADSYLDIPAVVLINQNTASAAELFAAALKDYDMAQLVGNITYGKGYMQSIITLSDGSGLRLSVAQYDPPYSENYEGIGVLPHKDISDDASTETDEQLEEAKKYFK